MYDLELDIAPLTRMQEASMALVLANSSPQINLHEVSGDEVEATLIADHRAPEQCF